MYYRYVLLGLLLIGCGPSQETQNKDQIERWEGQPVDRLIYKWGAPDATHQMQNGREVLTFEHETIEEDYSIDDNGRSYVSSVDQLSCRVDWITSPDGTYIEEGKSSGDASACRELIVPL